jgi:phage terminase large subunit-like protein
MNKEEKQAMLDVLRRQYKEQREQLAAIDQRLVEYYDGMCADVSGDGDPQLLHNGMEIAGAVKFLRLLRTYDFDHTTVADVIYKYEGEWAKRVDGWHHVGGGVMHPGITGDTYYRLQPFQVFVLAAMFGPRAWFNTQAPAGSRPLLPTEEVRDGMIYDHRRLCTEFTLYTPRKTAKTQLSAFIQFYYFMCGDDNAECFCAANASDQAKILFSRTKALIHQMDRKERRIRFTASQVNWKPGQFRTASLTALSAGGKTKDGLFAQLCSADEYGSAAYVNGASDMGKLVSVIESSMGPRREPMTFISTTAGIIRQGPFIDKLAAIHLELMKEADPDSVGASGDRQMCLLLEPDEWEQHDRELLLASPTVRRKINPMLGIICQHAFYDDEISKARQNPEKMNEVVSKLFNVYQTGSVSEWIKPEEVRMLQDDLHIDNLYGDEWKVCVGMDFSLGDDLYAVSYLIYNTDTDRFAADMDAWMSRDALMASTNRDLFLLWEQHGWLHVVEGSTIPPETVLTRIAELTNKGGVEFVGFGYDPYASKIPINALQAWVFEQGADPKQLIIPCRQTYASFNPVVEEMDYMLKASPAWITFSRNPMWPWEAGNMQLDEDSRMGNKKPIKRGASAKIDNWVALLMALMVFDLKDGQTVQE